MNGPFWHEGALSSARGQPHLRDVGLKYRGCAVIEGLSSHIFTAKNLRKSLPFVKDRQVLSDLKLYMQLFATTLNGHGYSLASFYDLLIALRYVLRKPQTSKEMDTLHLFLILFYMSRIAHIYLVGWELRIGRCKPFVDGAFIALISGKGSTEVLDFLTVLD